MLSNSSEGSTAQSESCVSSSSVSGHGGMTSNEFVATATTTTATTTAQCPNKKRDRSTSGVYEPCVCDTLPSETGVKDNTRDQSSNQGSTDYASSLKHASVEGGEENESGMKQSPSSGALNELISASDTVDPSLGSIKSRRTCMTKSNSTQPIDDEICKNTNAEEHEKLPSASSSDETSSYSTSSYTIGNDEAASDQPVKVESIHFNTEYSHSSTFQKPTQTGTTLVPHNEKPGYTNASSIKAEYDISDAVTILRIDSKQDLKKLQQTEVQTQVQSQVQPQVPLESERIQTPSSATSNSQHIKSHVPDNFSNINPEKLYASILVSKGYKNKTGDGDAKAVFRSSASFQDGVFFIEYTAEQLSSYSEGSIVSAVRKQDVDTLRTLHSKGFQMQCSNRFGESIVHLGCRLGSKPVVKFLLDEAGVSLRVRDDMGRTPMHDACWMREPDFELMDMLVKNDPDLLLIRDGRGFSPLSYVRREHWCQWCEFLLRCKDHLHPREL